MNEYIYDTTDEEKNALKGLEAYVRDILSAGKYLNPSFVLCLASYKPLHQYEWSDLIKSYDGIEDVLSQLLEPRQETKLKGEIPVLKQIENKISLKVKKQFENNPFPKWINLGP